MVCLGGACFHRGCLAYDALSSFVEVTVVFTLYDQAYILKAAVFFL